RLTTGSAPRHAAPRAGGVLCEDPVPGEGALVPLAELAVVEPQHPPEDVPGGERPPRRVDLVGAPAGREDALLGLLRVAVPGAEAPARHVHRAPQVEAVHALDPAVRREEAVRPEPRLVAHDQLRQLDALPGGVPGDVVLLAPGRDGGVPLP